MIDARSSARRGRVIASLLLALVAFGLLAAFAPQNRDGGGEFPDAWYFPDRATGGRNPVLKTLEGKPAPRLQLHEWIGAPQDLKKLKGKVVVVDFWATWCRPCVAAIPHNVKLVEEYGKKGLVVIGVHDSRRGYQQMPKYVEQLGVNYPVAIDKGGQSVRAYRLQFWPLYAVIDRKGVVRAAGLRPDYVDDVVKILLSEDV